MSSWLPTAAETLPVTRTVPFASSTGADGSSCAYAGEPTAAYRSAQSATRRGRRRGGMPNYEPRILVEQTGPDRRGWREPVRAFQVFEGSSDAGRIAPVEAAFELPAPAQARYTRYTGLGPTASLKERAWRISSASRASGRRTR